MYPHREPPLEGLDLFFFFDKLGLLTYINRGIYPVQKRLGFTLIELLVVVLIIGILAAVAVPQYTLSVEKARASEAVSLLRSLMDAQKVYYLANGQYVENFDDLDVGLSGVTGKNFYTKNFRFTIHQAGTSASFHFDCQRLNNDYQINGWLSPGAPLYDKIMCNPKTENGEKLCRSYGPKDPTLSNLYYPMY